MGQFHSGIEDALNSLQGLRRLADQINAIPRSLDVLRKNLASQAEQLLQTLRRPYEEVNSLLSASALATRQQLGDLQRMVPQTVADIQEMISRRARELVPVQEEWPHMKGITEAIRTPHVGCDVELLLLSEIQGLRADLQELKARDNPPPPKKSDDRPGHYL